MYLLITYDINVNSPTGPKRLRKVAQTCKNYGQRVQHSVFECQVSEVQMLKLLHEIEKIIDVEKDSVRIYQLPKQTKNKVIHKGAKEPLDFQDPLIL